MRLLIGLTGGIGSGKSAAADHFAALGASIVDTDLIAHALSGTNGLAMPALRQHFPAAITVDGNLDRAALRRQVFAEPAARARLEGILHPLIREEAERQILTASGPYTLAVVPLLAESPNWQARCARIAVVDCEPELQLIRVMARSGLSRSEAQAIIAAQADRATRLALADDIIDNNGSLDALHQSVAQHHQRYLALI